jgi:hypothetical protein
MDGVVSRLHNSNALSSSPCLLSLRLLHHQFPLLSFNNYVPSSRSRPGDAAACSCWEAGPEQEDQEAPERNS